MKKNIFLVAILGGITLFSCEAMIPTGVINPNQGSVITNPNHRAGMDDYSQSENFAGSYSNQGDVNRSGNFSMKLSQSRDHISGTARNSTGNGDDSGLLSVDGDVDGNVANLQFFDQRGNVVASGVLSHNEDAYSFIQNSNSPIIPGEAYMYRGR